MALQRQQEAEVFQKIQQNGLDPADFEWAPFASNVRNGVAVLAYKPLVRSRFQFIYRNSSWLYDYVPGTQAPRTTGNAGTWEYEMSALRSWLNVCKSEIEAPDLWGALMREREALARPAADATGDVNAPFTEPEVEQIRAEFAQLKEYVRSLGVGPAELQEVDAKLDYLVDAAQRAPGRIDWWNQTVGAIINLALTSAVKPDVVQNLLSMTAHALGHLFGGGVPTLGPGQPLA